MPNRLLAMMVVYLVLISGSVCAKNNNIVPCYSGISLNLNSKLWKKVGKGGGESGYRFYYLGTSLAFRPIIEFGLVDEFSPNISRPSKDEIDLSGADPEFWYVGGVKSSAATPAMASKLDRFIIYEAVSQCSVEYRNGLTGQGLCYNARIIGPGVDIAVLGGGLLTRNSRRYQNRL